jgi:hypothetical protein
MKIDKGVKMPSRKSYHWQDVQIGDSIFYDDEPKATQSNPSISARSWGYANNAKFSARKEGNGVRIWRVA